MRTTRNRRAPFSKARHGGTRYYRVLYTSNSSRIWGRAEYGDEQHMGKTQPRYFTTRIPTPESCPESWNLVQHARGSSILKMVFYPRNASRCPRTLYVERRAYSWSAMCIFNTRFSQRTIAGTIATCQAVQRSPEMRCMRSLDFLWKVCHSQARILPFLKVPPEFRAPFVRSSTGAAVERLTTLRVHQGKNVQC